MSTQRVVMQGLVLQDGDTVGAGPLHYQRLQSHAAAGAVAACPDVRSMCGHIVEGKTPCIGTWASSREATCSICERAERRYPQDAVYAEEGYAERWGVPQPAVERPVGEIRARARSNRERIKELSSALEHAEIRIAQLMEREDLWTKWFKETINNAPEPQ